MSCKDKDGLHPQSDLELTVSYQMLRQLLPRLTDAEWLHIRNAALDSSLRKLMCTIQELQAKGSGTPVTTAELAATLQRVADVFKWQRLSLPPEPTLSSAGTPRKWIGFSLEESEKGLVTRSVLAGSPAKAADVRSGDVLTKLGGRSISKLDDFRSAIEDLPTGKSSPIDVLRLGKKVTLALTSELQVPQSKGGVVSDMKCNEDCQCVVKSPKATCWSYWIYRGDGPHGGVLFKISCTTINEDGWPISHKSCDVDGEFF